jgi:hypothetical protein
MQAIHWQLMKFHARWCELVAGAMKEKCLGNDDAAKLAWKNAIVEFGQNDIFLDPWFDMSQAAVSFNRIMAAVRPIADF